MAAIILLIIFCILLSVLGVIALILAFHGDEAFGFLFLGCIMLIIICVFGLVRTPKNSNPTENYMRYQNLISMVEDCKENPYSNTSKLVMEAVDEWNSDYIDYTSHINSWWDGSKYSEEAFKNCDTIDYWEIIYDNATEEGNRGSEEIDHWEVLK